MVRRDAASLGTPVDEWAEMRESSLDGEAAKWNEADADDGVDGFDGDAFDFDEGVRGGGAARKGLALDADEAEGGRLAREGVVEPNGEGIGLDGVEYGADRVDRAELGPAVGGGDLEGRPMFACRAFDGEVETGGGGCLDDEDGRADAVVEDELGPGAAGGFRDLL